MGCFACFSCQESRGPSRRSRSRSSRNLMPAAAPPQRSDHPPTQPRHVETSRRVSTEASNSRQQGRKSSFDASNNNKSSPRRSSNDGKVNLKDAANGNIAAQTFTFRELASATKNFRQECLVGEGGFGRVYKGKLPKTGQVVAIKQLDRNGVQGNREFLVEVLMLSLLHHSCLVSLIGYCADGEQRLLVYEFMESGSLEDHLLDLRPGKEPLEWFRRMKIALDAAKGLEYLHDKANPPVIYRDLKSSNILLDKDFNAKLSDFGLAKLGPVGDKSHVSSRVMGTYGYCAPEYQRTGQLTVKSDVYSYGVVLLEMITGRRAIDTTKRNQEQTLVSWAEPMFRKPSRFSELADPLLEGNFPKKSLYQAVAVAAMCLHSDAAARPLMSDVVSALSVLGVGTEEEAASPLSAPSPQAEITTTDGNDESQVKDINTTEHEVDTAEAKEFGSTSRDQNATTQA